MADLAALLDKQASAEITAILSEARSRASEIAAAAQAEADAQTAARERSSRSQADATLVRARSAAQLEASSIRLGAQHRAVESVFAEAEAGLTRVTAGSDWPAILEKLMAEAIAATGLPAAEVKSVAVNAADLAAGSTAAAALGVKAEVMADDAVKGGVVVVAGDSGITISNTLAGRLAAARDDLAAEVWQRLAAGKA